MVILHVLPAEGRLFFFHLALFNRGFLSAVIFTRKSKEEITKGETKGGKKKLIASLIKPSSRLLSVVARSYTGPTLAIKFTPLCVCWCVCFSPPPWSSSAVWRNQGFRIMPFPFCARLIFQIKNKKSTQMCFLPDWSAIPSTPPKTPRCRRVKSCNSAPLSLAASAVSASRPPRGPRQGVRAVKNQPLPQTLTSKSIRVPFSDQFVKAPLGSRGPECVYVCVHPKISRFSRVTQTVQHLIQHRQPSPDTDLANCLLSGLTSL